MSATAVAGIVRAMTIERPEPIPLSADAAAPDSSSALTQGILGVIRLLRRVLLPHLVVGLGFFIFLSYVTYQTFFPSLYLPAGLKNILAVLFFLSYGAIVFFYSLTASGVYALWLACTTWENFIDDMLERVQDKMISRLDEFQDSIAKDQAKVLVRGSVREVYENTRRSTTLPRWGVALTLGALMLVVRAVLTARVVKVAGTTIKVSKLFAGKATLVGAIFLNLRLFSALLLGAIYLIGCVALVLNVALVWGR